MMKKAIILCVVALAGCSSGNSSQANDPKLASAYQKEIECASAAVGAGVSLIGAGKDSAEMQNAALTFMNKAIDDGAVLGKSKDTVMSDIDALNVKDGPKKAMDAAMNEKVKQAAICIAAEKILEESKK